MKFVSTVADPLCKFKLWKNMNEEVEFSELFQATR